MLNSMIKDAKSCGEIIGVLILVLVLVAIGVFIGAGLGMWCWNGWVVPVTTFAELPTITYRQALAYATMLYVASLCRVGTGTSSKN